MDDNITPLASGRSVIKRYLENLPGSPGVYRMLAEDGGVLYVGKAKNLKNRVANYVGVEALNTRLQRMVAQTVAMEFIVTRSEAEALLLEANLIKKFSPRYNILLKDDKSFPYIALSAQHSYPRISKYRGPKQKNMRYFGPFVSGLAVNETITLLQRAFLLRPCADTVFKNRSRPCLQYQIKRCSGPCVGLISEAEYAVLVAQATDFLSGRSRDIIDQLTREMQAASQAMDFERAGALRDRMRALTQVQQQHAMTSAKIGDADVIALERNSAHCCIQLFSFRGGRNYGNKSWFPARAQSYDDAEVMSQFIGQYYQTQPVPQLILVSHMPQEAALLEEALGSHSGHSVSIASPQRGDKREVMQEALRNAREALLRQAAMEGAQQEVLEKLQQLFELDEPPTRIEVYDNSHISGTHATGAMIVAGPSGFLKNEYRKFNMKSAAGDDDYAMMREMFTRRLQRLHEQREQDPSKVPSLVLIDGGAGQLAAVSQVFADMGITQIRYAAIAKGPDRNAGREQFFLPGREPFQLPVDDPLLHYLQRLRDEAHRFAIGTHRNKRSKSMQVSELDRIEGIGGLRKRALLLHFGSPRAVAAASEQEIAQVPGISRAMAQRIYAHFHGESN